MFLQLVVTAMGTKFAPPYACLSVGYLEEAILFPHLLLLQFTLSPYILIFNCLDKKLTFFNLMP